MRDDHVKLGIASNMSGAFGGLDRLKGPLRERLCNTMALKGAQIIRDEAILRAPVGKAEHSLTRQFGGSKRPGLLKSAIYAAYSDKMSTDTKVHYVVSWNHGVAPHGYLAEFGHRVPYLIFFDAERGWVTDKSKPNPNGKPVKGQSFIGAAFDAKIGSIYKPMVAAGQAIFPTLLREAKGNV